MQFQHVPASCRLVKSVNILGDNRRKLASRFQLGKLTVGRIGLRIQKHHLVLIEFIKIFRSAYKETVANDLFRGVLILLQVEPVSAPKIRNITLRGYACAPEKHDVAAVVNNPL